MSDKTNQHLSPLIEELVTRFYEKATTDIIIGYHFRKIQALEAPSSHHALKPPIEAFREHIPRIVSFWEIQLLGSSQRPEKPFQLIEVHRQLNVLPGEVGRWMQLFKDTLKEKKEFLAGALGDDKNIESQSQLHEQIALIKEWEKKLDKFRDIFMTSTQLFQQST